MIMPTLNVADLAASVTFYCDVLGFTKVLTMPDADGNDGYAIVKRGHGVDIGLQVDPSTYVPGKGLELMIYVADDADLEAYYAEVQGKTAIIAPLETKFWGDQLFSVTDPDGYLISMCKTVKQLSPEEIMAAQPESA
jgi:uncharacterized glyoxalase superfamily protein PhnB